MKDISKTELSIVMPVFNRKDLLRVMIESILASTYQNWELLAIDDGSTDGAYELLQEYAAHDKRIKPHLRTEQPKGAQTCRNKGFGMAQGEYVVFFDSDDYITPACLEQRVHNISQRPELDFMVFPSGVLIDGKMITIRKKNIYGYPIYSNDLKTFAARILPFVVWNNIYRAESLRKHGITWDTKLQSLQDADFNLSTILAGMHYDYCLAPADYAHRISSSNSVSQAAQTLKHLDNHICAMSKFFETIQQHYGHKYDRDLYRGAIWIYSFLFFGGIDREAAQKLVDAVSCYSKKYGRIFSLQVAATCLLQKFLPARTARQLPTLPVLLWRVAQRRRDYRRVRKIRGL